MTVNAREKGLGWLAAIGVVGLIPAVVGSGSASVLRDNCTTPVFQDGLDVVFGRASSQTAAKTITQDAEAAGFEGLKTVQENCGVWESVLRGVNSFDVALNVQSEARHVRLYPTIECMTANQIGQLQAIFGTTSTLAELRTVIATANSVGYVGLKTKTAPCGGYEAFVAGFNSRAEADSFAKEASQRTGLNVTVIKA